MKHVFAALASIFGGGASPAPKPQNPKKRPAASSPFAPAIQILKEFGIGGLDDPAVREMEEALSRRSIKTQWAIIFLLEAVGKGRWDKEAQKWIPSQNGVYFFDVEVSYPNEEIYTSFLRGISALDEEELAFQNLQEELGEGNWETCKQTHTVHFDWKGRTYSLEAEQESDWFDLTFASRLNQIIQEKGGEKKLMCIGDGQAIFIFYRDEAWAEAFQKKTGLIFEDFSSSGEGSDDLL